MDSVKGYDRDARLQEEREFRQAKTPGEFWGPVILSEPRLGPAIDVPGFVSIRAQPAAKCARFSANGSGETRRGE